MDNHLERVFSNETSDKPTFYVSATSKTDHQVGESIFILVPMAYGLDKLDTPEYRETLFNYIIKQMTHDNIVTESGNPLLQEIGFYKIQWT